MLCLTLFQMNANSIKYRFIQKVDKMRLVLNRAKVAKGQHRPHKTSTDTESIQLHLHRVSKHTFIKI